jgi:hypothetical protein
VEETTERAAAFNQRALRFRCLETSRVARYRQGEAVREKGKHRRYLLTRDETGAIYRALRGDPTGEGGLSDQVRFPYPEPLAWTQLFDPVLRSQFRFRVGEPATTPWRLARNVEFEAAAPVAGGRRIAEWSGTAWVEVRTGNLLRVVASPNLQEARLLAEYHRWIQAFRFLGLQLAPAPRGQQIQVDFDREHEGFLYPSRVELRTIRMVAAGRVVTESRTVVEYTGYEFFRTEARDELGEIKQDR